MLSAFKIKPFDLEPVYAAWTDGPKFTGNPKKDLPVDDWLDKIKAGCIERNVPEEYWHKVAQHFMGPKAKARLDELKAVISKVHGGKYRWTWKKYRIAMHNMGWTIDPKATQTIKVQGKTSGLWWSLRKKDDDIAEEEPAKAAATLPPRPIPKRSSTSFWRTTSREEELQAQALAQAHIQNQNRPVPTRSGSDFWPVRRNSRDEGSKNEPLVQTQVVVKKSSTIKMKKSNSKEGKDTSKDVVPHVPKHKKSKPDMGTTERGTPRPPMPTRSSTGETVTTVTNAPVWLLNACTALDFITSEHPKAMSVLSAILITAGSLPAIPAVAAGAGGAVLASGAAHAIGAIAVGLGQALSNNVKNQQNSQSAEGSSVVH